MNKVRWFWNAREFLGLAALIVLASLVSHPVYAWGENGHKLVNQAAVRLMSAPDKDFFSANESLIVNFSTTPDVSWKKPETYDQERSLHFFQWDQYEKSELAKFFPADLASAIGVVGAPFLEKNGKAPWRVAQIYNLLKSALESGDCERAIQMAGVMGHYVGDLSQPMHNTSDYDGQSIHRPGIHKYFEVTLVDQEDHNHLLDEILRASAPKNSNESSSQVVVDDCVHEGQTAMGDLGKLLQDFTSTPENDSDLKQQFPALMSRGSLVLAKLWNLASEEASHGGSPKCPAKSVTVAAPAWFPLQ